MRRWDSIRPWLWGALWAFWSVMLLLNAAGIIHQSRWWLALVAFNFGIAGERTTTC